MHSQNLALFLFAKSPQPLPHRHCLTDHPFTVHAWFKRRTLSPSSPPPHCNKLILPLNIYIYIYVCTNRFLPIYLYIQEETQQIGGGQESCTLRDFCWIMHAVRKAYTVCIFVRACAQHFFSLNFSLLLFPILSGLGLYSLYIRAAMKSISDDPCNVHAAFNAPFYIKITQSYECKIDYRSSRKIMLLIYRMRENFWGSEVKFSRNIMRMKNIVKNLIFNFWVLKKGKKKFFPKKKNFKEIQNTESTFFE